MCVNVRTYHIVCRPTQWFVMVITRGQKVVTVLFVKEDIYILMVSMLGDYLMLYRSE